MADLDPELMKQLKAQGFLAEPLSAMRGAPAAPVAPPASAPLSPTEQMLSGGLQGAGVPQTVKAGPAGAAAAPRAQGIFEGGEAPEGGGAPQWKPPAAHAVAPHAVSTVSPGIRTEYDAAYGNMAGGAEETARAQGVANERMATMNDQHAEAMGKLMREQDLQRKVRTQALEGQMADYKRLQDEAADQKVNPDHWWGSKNVGEKALGVIGIIFGGLSQGQGHGNPAMDLMNQFINRDIDAQKANIAQKGKKAEGAQNLYAQKLAQFGNEDAADLATRAQMQEQFKLQLQSEALRSGSPVLMAKAEEQAGPIALEQAKTHSQMEKWAIGGTAGGASAEDQKRAFEMVKGGMTNPNTGKPVTPDEAIQIAMNLRGAAPSTGYGVAKPGKAGGGKADKEDLAAARLEESGKRPIESLGAWDRVTAAGSHIPGVGLAFQGTEGARKEQAIKASNVPVYGYAHTGLGMRRTEDMEHATGALMIQPSDTQARINQKLALRALTARDMKAAIEEAKKVGIDLGVSEKRAAEDDSEE